ncbi:hypothetical protein [Cognatiyoonia sp. IB215182]|uniref:hypothetical protein n=1 Tax=Cognatiyoonia sp. IB215182 TaxID=3097353 RepID=UPI002A122F53|nr:hypothetical protein [Cognatiyoonia sp. IB215182]MDX8351427.1 hypothetical protein [Cognatiyoonia sp. IB215182]
MKRPRTQMPRRPKAANGAIARTSKEAAIHLVRLEFDAARLQMGIDQAQDRADNYAHELARNQEQRQRLLGLLSG